MNDMIASFFVKLQWGCSVFYNKRVVVISYKINKISIEIVVEDFNVGLLA
jgi:hypothetical protein